MYKYGLVICCFNRPEYVNQTFQSLKKSNIQDTHICIIDDFSDDNKVSQLIEQFNMNNKNIKITKLKNKKNLGISKSLLKGFTYLYSKCDYLLNIDSDVIMNKNWLDTLYKTYNIFKLNNKNDCIVTGFNCIESCDHKIIHETNDYNVKSSIGGINMFFNKSVYDKIIKNVLIKSDKSWDWDVVNETIKYNIKLITTKPSCIQHIGFSGLNSNNNRYDTADDFDINI
jgi:GT2 family glycosyltransferase